MVEMVLEIGMNDLADRLNEMPECHVNLFMHGKGYQ